MILIRQRVDKQRSKRIRRYLTRSIFSATRLDMFSLFFVVNIRDRSTQEKHRQSTDETSFFLLFEPTIDFDSTENKSSLTNETNRTTDGFSFDLRSVSLTRERRIGFRQNRSIIKQSRRSETFDFEVSIKRNAPQRRAIAIAI